MTAIIIQMLGILVAICLGTWLAMVACGISRLGLSFKTSTTLAVEVMIQVPGLCFRILNHRLGIRIRMSTLKASEISYLAVFPLDKAEHSQVYIGRSVREAKSEEAIAALLSDVKAHAPGHSRDSYGIVHLKTGRAFSWIYRHGKFTISHDFACTPVDSECPSDPIASTSSIAWHAKG